MQNLSREDRLRLMKFVCSFAWTDFEVVKEERDLVERLVRTLGFDEEEREQIARWLEYPPRPEEVDPLQIPREHRELFCRAAQQMIEADGKIVSYERDSMMLFRELLDS